VLRD